MNKINKLQLVLIITLLISFSQAKAQSYFTQNTTNGLPSITYKVDIGDVDNDGDIDVIMSDYSNVSIYTNNGSGSFTLMSGVSFSSITYEFANPKFIDIDSDNDLDVVITAANYGSTPNSQLYRNDGGSTFTQITSFPAANMYLTEIAVVDYNNDSHDDLIITGTQTSGNSQIYSPFINDGNGNFSTTLKSLTVQHPWSNAYAFVTMADLNGTGIKDDIVSTYTKKLELRRDLGAGAGSLLINDTYNNFNSIVVDVDGDGDMDIIGNYNTTVLIFLNDGSGNFTQSSQTLSGGGVGLMAAADVDNDGDMDILRKGFNASYNGYIGGLYINDSKNNFYLNSTQTLPDINPGYVKFADMNGDNYPELLINSNSSFYYYDNTYTTNHPDRALDFDGTNTYTTNHDAALNTLPMTIEFQVQDGSGTTAGLMNKQTGDNGFQVGLVYGRLYADYKVDNTNFAFLNQVFNIGDGNWHHVAIVIESTGMKLYGDGVEQSSTTWNGTAGVMTDISGLELGKWTLDANKFSGNLDEVRIWNTARTHAEIVNNMCGKITNPESDANLVAYYSMDDYLINTSVVFDGSSNHNHLTISGGTQTMAAEQVGCTAPVLPVEMTYFTGKATDNGNVLQWQTASEENNQGFEIERSLDGHNWENIGFVHGNGTTVDISNYEFTDNRTDVLIKRLYYRLKQIDYDGNYNYSNIVNITIESPSSRDRHSNNQTLNIFPNPATDILTVEIDKPVFLQIINSTGQVVKEINLQSNQINISDLENGVYWLKTMIDGNSVIQSFVKQ